MNQLFAMTLQEGAEAARCDGCPNATIEQTAGINYATTEQTAGMNYVFPILSTLLFIASIIAIMMFVKDATKSINHKTKFDGTKWGLINGICGLGFIFVIAAIILIYNEIKKVKGGWYIGYAKKELKKFVLAYIACCVAWIMIGFIVGFLMQNKSL